MVVDSPRRITPGAVEKELMTGGAGGATVTVTAVFFVTLPDEFVAVSV
ncbi:MAG: hypothetical protein NTV51_17705 [Verrucomicrobia bacterium]|nr:hypothetical protein [Verrucomicrobiota bacterium]